MSVASLTLQRTVSTFKLRKQPAKIAICAEDESGVSRTISYGELLFLSNKIANALILDLKIKRGDKIGLFMPMIPEAVAAFLAIVKIGAVVIPLFSGYGPESISTRLSDCEAVALITADSFQRRGKTIAMGEIAIEGVKSVSSIRALLIFEKERNGSSKFSDRATQLFYWDVVEKQSSENIPEKMDSEDPFMIIYTSGTTGKPKGAVHVHGGFLVKVVEEVSFQMDLRWDDRLFWVTDMGWIMAPWEIVGALSQGGTLVIYDGAPDYPTRDRLWKVIERFGVTKLGISPTLVRGLMKYGTEPLSGHELSSLRAFGSTGEPWNPESVLLAF